MRSSLSLKVTSHSQLDEHIEVKSESPRPGPLSLPICHQSNPAPPVASISSSHLQNLNARGGLTAASTRQATRGSLAAVAEAARQSKIIAPDPESDFGVSDSTYSLTRKTDWVLPSPQFDVSLAQIIPRDCKVEAWMKYTRCPIVWDGTTDAGKCRSLVVAL